ncbi:MAG: protein kinase [Terriglobales bacterium]
MASRASGQDSLVGSELGHYRIVEKIGAGGMGEVYRARDQHLDCDVAIKVLPPRTSTDDSAHKHFRKEALALSRLNHSNIATIHDFDTQQGVDFLVMEYIPGITLSEKVAARALPEKEVLRLGVQLAEGLAAAHDHGVVHRDLKPGNLRVASDGRLKILDFGLAKLWHPVTASATTESLSETQAMAGTLPYMAPEQLLGGEVDARTDIHAAGYVLYEMATGQRPFAEVERSQLIGAILHRPPVPSTELNPRISPELERIIGKCLEKDPNNRYQSARELAVDLRRVQTGVPSGVHLAARWPKWSIQRLLALVLGILAVVVLSLLAYKMGNSRQPVLRRTDAARIQSLAVLPLTNLSGDPQQEYFADGMTEQLIADIGKIGALRVISRTSVMQYKNANKALPTIARELNVDAVLEGSVLRSGKRVRITAQLIQAKPEQQLWAENYERDLSDILVLQSEVARSVAAAIQVELAPHEQTTLASTRSVVPAAYEAYLQGRYYWNSRTREGVLRGLAYFEKAVRLDPTYALAYAGIADSYIVLIADHWLSPGEAMPPAKAAALKALGLDEALAEAHTSMASIAESDWDWVTAEREYQRAQELNPNYATAHHWYSIFLSEMGRHEDAVVQARRALDIDPLSSAINTNLGEVLYQARRYDEAERVLSKFIEMEPRFWPAYYSAGRAYVQNGQFNEGIAALKQAAVLSPGDDVVLSALVYAYGRAGRKTEAQQVLKEWKNLSRQRYVSGYLLAQSYLGLGEKEKAMQSLAKAYQERDTLVIAMGSESMLDPLCSDSRFQDLLRRMNLAQRPSC